MNTGKDQTITSRYPCDLSATAETLVLCPGGAWGGWYKHMTWAFPPAKEKNQGIDVIILSLSKAYMLADTSRAFLAALCVIQT